MSITISGSKIITQSNDVNFGDRDPTHEESLIQINTYTSGSGTWTKPSGCDRILVKVTGGGGGGAGYCESGGAGGYAEKLLEANDVPDTVSWVVGSGGSGVGYYNSAGGGGTSSFGGLVMASGGRGANSNAAHSGGHGGYGYTGGGSDAFISHGGDGTGHANHAGHGQMGTGGGSYWGGSSTIYRDGVTAKISSGAPGSGGPGGRTDDGNAGSSGENGLIIVYSYG